ncbi:MAG TPA: DoxX family protein [Phenylobacterium sp.]
MTATAAAPLAPSSRAAIISGWAFSGLVIAFLLMDAGMKLIAHPMVAQTMVQLGWSPETARPLGIVLLACTALYAIPRTSVLGAVLLTAYLGGAVATHVRVDSPLFSHVLFGVYIAIMAWGGLWLRSPRLRAVFPLRQG